MRFYIYQLSHGLIAQLVLRYCTCNHRDMSSNLVQSWIFEAFLIYLLIRMPILKPYSYLMSSVLDVRDFSKAIFCDALVSRFQEGTKRKDH